MEALEIAMKYFDYSNQSNFNKIKIFFTKHSTYSSANTGLYLGVDEIMKMQELFHTSFERLHWDIISINEEKPGIICVDFEFEGVRNGENIKFSAREYIVIGDGKIQHIEIKNN